MTIEMLDVLRNIYSAGGGAAHPSAVSAALFGLMWNSALSSATAAGHSAHSAGASDEDTSRVFHETFADAMGWSAEQAREFWRSHRDTATAADGQRFDESWDAFDDFAAHMRRGRR